MVTLRVKAPCACGCWGTSSSRPAPTEGFKERVTTGWNHSPDSESAQLRGLSTFSALFARASLDTLVISLHWKLFSFGPLGRDVSEPRESDSPSRLPSTKLTNRAPTPCSEPALLGAFCLGVCKENASVSRPPGVLTSLHARVLREAPRIKAFLPPARPGGRVGDSSGAGRPAKQAPGDRLASSRPLGRLSPARTFTGA